MVKYWTTIKWLQCRNGLQNIYLIISHHTSKNSKKCANIYEMINYYSIPGGRFNTKAFDKAIFIRMPFLYLSIVARKIFVADIWQIISRQGRRPELSRLVTFFFGVTWNHVFAWFHVTSKCESEISLMIT